ncbi:hypothetical protein NOC27_2571 [Nitrosococcus oceani AFC27]|nr:hypothetical protein NOC27_2571 [Nitrosococcus oceani AFC27]
MAVWRYKNGKKPQKVFCRIEHQPQVFVQVAKTALADLSSKSNIT